MAVAMLCLAAVFSIIEIALCYARCDKMVDIDNRYGHGGGKFEYDGSNLIPVGALKNYEGPCPMSSMNPRYEIRLKAIDENGKVIAFGKKFKKYPPEPE